MKKNNRLSAANKRNKIKTQLNQHKRRKRKICILCILAPPWIVNFIHS